MEEGILGLLIVLKMQEGRKDRVERRLDESTKMPMEILHRKSNTFTYLCKD